MGDLARGLPLAILGEGSRSSPAMEKHAEWFLFAWVFDNQAGIPLPVVPALLGAGVLVGSGYLSMAPIICIAVGASLAADLTWFGLGRWRGARVALRSSGARVACWPARC